MISTPEFGPGMLGPAARPDDQGLWDPAHQAMDPSLRRELQDRRVRHLVGRVLGRRSRCSPPSWRRPV